MLTPKMMGLLNKKSKKKEDLDTAKFFVACQEDNLERIQRYLQQKRFHTVDLATAVDEYGRTALHIASEYGHVNLVRYLVHECHVDVETKNDTGSTALHFACRRNQLRMVQYLLGDNNDCDINKTTKKKQDCCYANVRAVDEADHTALHFASYFGYLDIVRYLVDRWPNNIVARGKEGHTPLHTASETGQLDVMMYFLQECDADPAVTTRHGMTPLHFAAQQGHLHVVKYLILQCHVHMNPIATTTANTTTSPTTITKQMTTKTTSTRPQQQVTPYDLAVVAKQTEVMEFLELRRELIHLYFGSIENGNYSSFLKCILATSTNRNSGSGNSGSTSTLPNKGYGIDVATTKNENGNMALHVAASNYQSNSGGGGSCSGTTNGYLEIVKYIVQELHIRRDVTNDDGWTALHFASAIGHLTMVQYLVEQCRPTTSTDIAATIFHHANNPPTKDVDGDTPLHLASRNGHLTIVQYFVSVCHVSLACTNDHQQTPHEVACISGQDAIVEYYVQRQELEDQFFEAVQQGDLDRMKKCMQQKEYGIDVTTLNINQSTVLHFACRYGHLHIVQYLTQHYDDTVVNVNARNKDGCTPLHFASGSGHLPIVKYLIEEEGCHSIINDMTNDGDTAYDLAFSFDSYNVADYLSHIAKHPKMSGTTSTTASSSSSRSLQHHQLPTPSLRTSFRTSINTMPNTADNDAGLTQPPPLDPEIVADRHRLAIVIDDPTADPIIIGVKYLDFCTNQFTSKLLGEGAFGKVYLGYDHDLNNVQLAIKRIRFDVLDENKMNQITISFRREIAVRSLFWILLFILFGDGTT